MYIFPPPVAQIRRSARNRKRRKTFVRLVPGRSFRYVGWPGPRVCFALFWPFRPRPITSRSAEKSVFPEPNNRHISTITAGPLFDRGGEAVGGGGSGGGGGVFLRTLKWQ